MNGSAKGDAPAVEAVTTHWDTQPLIARGLDLCADGSSSVVLRRPDIEPATTAAVGSSAVEAGDRLMGGLVLRSDASDVRGGKRPEIRISCHDDGGHSIFVQTVEEPGTPPPLSAPGTIGFDGRSVPVPFAWFSGDSWSVRDEVDRKTLVAQASRARSITVTLPAHYLPTGEIRWTIDVAEGDRARFRRQCATGR